MSRKHPPRTNSISGIPEDTLRKLSQSYNLKQVIIIGLEEDSGVMQSASYGRNRHQQASVDKLLDALTLILKDHGWPPSSPIN